MEEVHMVVRIARRYYKCGLKFCVITFYDPQRAALSKALEAENLPTGCVHNVDSFQGMGHPRCISDALRSTIAGRERSRLCDLVFSPDPKTRIPDFAAPHERCPDPLPQGNGSRHRQIFPARGGEEYATGSTRARLVTAP